MEEHQQQQQQHEREQEVPMEFSADGSSPIYLVPKDILRHIFQFLQTDTILIAARVCRNWEMVCNSSQLWKHLCMRDHRGSFDIIQYRVDLEDSSKKRKRDSPWKRWYIQYHCHQWFIQGKLDQNIIFNELDINTMYLMALIDSNLNAHPQHLLWLYSIVYHSSNTVSNGFETRLKTQSDSAIQKFDNNLKASLSTVQYPEQWIEMFVACRKKHLKFVKTIVSFHPVKLRNAIELDGHSSFKQHLFDPLKEKIEQIIDPKGSLEGTISSDVISALGSLYEEFGFEFPLPNPSKETIFANQSTARLPTQVIGSDGVVVNGAQHLIQMSPVLRAIFQLPQ